MTRADMQKALETGFNKQGRHLSESMRVKYLAAIAVPDQRQIEAESYRGFEISGRSGKWFVDTFPVVYASRQQAREQVDRCISLRAEMAEDAQ